MYDLLEGVIPKDHSKQVTSWYFTDEILRRNNMHTVIDLGCGVGNSIDYFKKKDPNIEWVGVDIESSPEVNSRIRNNVKFMTFDGINLPFDNNSLDMVFSNQAFEHVKYPRKLLKEIQRVLVPKGCFVGSVSHLEPYHSHSLWNYTPYGFKILVEEAGMKLKELRPGIDVFTMLFRRISRSHAFFNRYSMIETPLNKLIGLIGFITQKKHAEINLIKLLFCGQFMFLAQKDKIYENY